MQRLEKKVIKSFRSKRYARILNLAKLVYDGIDGLETPLLTSDLHSLFFIFLQGVFGFPGAVGNAGDDGPPVWHHCMIFVACQEEILFVFSTIV